MIPVDGRDIWRFTMVFNDGENCVCVFSSSWTVTLPRCTVIKQISVIWCFLFEPHGFMDTTFSHFPIVVFHETIKYTNNNLYLRIRRRCMARHPVLLPKHGTQLSQSMLAVDRRSNVTVYEDRSRCTGLRQRTVGWNSDSFGLGSVFEGEPLRWEE